MKLFLIGFMGCGKSSIGEMLSKELKLNFIDTDILIESLYNSTIEEIFINNGEAFFREIEKTILDDIIQKNEDNILVACGGGMPCFHNNLEKMNSYATTIYIDTSVDALFQRLKMGKNSKRFLIKNMSDKDLLSYIKTSLLHRENIYKMAQHIVLNNSTSDKCLSEIIKIIN